MTLAALSHYTYYAALLPQEKGLNLAQERQAVVQWIKPAQLCLFIEILAHGCRMPECFHP
jgi:hypothetical protein